MKRAIKSIVYSKDISCIYETPDLILDLISRYTQLEYTINPYLVDLHKLYYCDITNSSSNRYGKFC